MNIGNLILLPVGQTETYLSENGAGLIFCPRYVPPYEQFTEIKRLQLVLQKKALEAREGVFICLGEWTAHKNEEYFEIFLKYLHDHRGDFVFSFIAEAENERVGKDLVVLLRRYLHLHTVKADLWADCARVEERFLRLGYDRAAARFLARLFERKELASCKNSGFLALLTEETRALCARPAVGMKELRRCFGNGDYVLRLLLGGVPQELDKCGEERSA